MNHFEKFIGQYRNLNREIYVLFWGRIVTSMGSLIWPLLTLILKNKLGYDATTIALITMVMSILQFPMLLLGGKLADSRNRKHIIVSCDLVTVGCCILAGLIPLSNISIALYYIASVFATIEGPSYDALVADLSDSDSREKAYSLQYLGMNLGLVLAPTLGGLLFENYLWLAFLITAGATLSSTLLIIIFIKRLSVEKAHISQYEQDRQEVSLISILRERKSVVLYALVGGFGSFVYAQFNYLLPLNMESLYGAKGAEIFGLLTSVNALVVILATPLVTTFLGKIRDVKKLLIGQTLIVLGLYSYRYVQLQMALYFLLMVIFTIGEVFKTLGGTALYDPAHSGHPLGAGEFLRLHRQQCLFQRWQPVPGPPAGQPGLFRRLAGRGPCGNWADHPCLSSQRNGQKGVSAAVCRKIKDRFP